MEVAEEGRLTLDPPLVVEDGSRRGRKANLKVMVFLASHDLHEVCTPRHATNFEAVLLLVTRHEHGGRGRRRGRRRELRLLQHL